MHVIVANEPALYREVIAAAIQTLRPNLHVVATEPAGLDEAVGRLAPDLALCSRLTNVVERSVPAWVMVYPGGTRRVTVSLAGRRRGAANLELAGLLAIVDQAAGPAVEG